MNRLETKVPPVAVFIISALLIWFISKYGSQVEVTDLTRSIIAFCFVLSGAVSGLYGIYSFRKIETTTNPMQPEKADQIVTTGIYRLSRHPMYFGLALVLIALSVYLKSLWALPVVLLFMIYMTRFQIIPEERAMIKLFGDEYFEYMKNVRRWI